MVYEDVLELIYKGDVEISESFKCWCQYHDVDIEDEFYKEDFAIDYSTGLWR